MRMMTGGESHGPAVVAIVDAVPSGLPITAADIDLQLSRRRMGHGRGGRMRIESDAVDILSGVRNGFTMGSPVTLLIQNRDHDSWRDVMSPEPGARAVPETRPRPGHADMAGMLKHGIMDARNVLERASARETAARVAGCSLARRLLQDLGIDVYSRVIAIGGANDGTEAMGPEVFKGADASEVRCADSSASASMMRAIDVAAEAGDSLGGIFEVAVFGAPPGLGSYAQAEHRLDGRLFAALASIPAIKGVEAGAGFSAAAASGSGLHDEMFAGGSGIRRMTNRAGGLEAGMTNGEAVLLRAAMKPIPSLAKPLATVDLADMAEAQAFKERSDVCAVPAAAVVGEAVVAMVLANAVLEKFGCDSMEDIRAAFDRYLERISPYWKRPD